MVVIAGADISIQADLGQAAFILNRDHLNQDVLTPPDDAYDDVSCDVARASWSKGAGQPLGPLTAVSGGRGRFDLIDPLRTFDPSNPSSPIYPYIHLGTPIRVLADGAPLWTGALDSWSYDLGTVTATLQAIDAYAVLAGLALPPASAIPAGWSTTQMAAMLDAAGWPKSRRVFYGTPGAYRSAVTVSDSVAEAIQAVRLAELGDLWADAAGNIAARGRGTPYAPPPVAVINCGGALLASLASVFARDRVRNRIEVDGHTPAVYTDAASVQRHGPRTFGSSVADLALTDAPPGLMAVLSLSGPEVAPAAPPASLTASLSSAFMSPSYGGGADQHLPVGSWSGNAFRSAIRFPAIDWSGVASVTSATLKIRTTGQVHVGFGSGPRITVKRLTESWSPNSASNDGGSFSSAPEAYPGPGATTAGQVSPTITRAEELTVSIDVSAIVRAWAPAAAGGGGAGQYGLGLFPYVEGNGAYTTEFYSARASGKQPTLSIVVVTNRPPNAPVPVSPIGPGGSVSPGFVANVSDPDGDPIVSWNVELVDGITSAAVWSKTAATGITGGTVTAAYDGPALTLGHAYQWRMRVQDAPGSFGPMSGWTAFTLGVAPAEVYSRWASTILAALANPKPLTILGTIRPVDDEVAAIVGAEYGDRLEVVDVHVSPPIDRLVRILGMTVDLAPSGFAVTIASEDV